MTFFAHGGIEYQKGICLSRLFATVAHIYQCGTISSYQNRFLIRKMVCVRRSGVGALKGRSKLHNAVSQLSFPVTKNENEWSFPVFVRFSIISSSNY